MSQPPESPFAFARLMNLGAAEPNGAGPTLVGPPAPERFGRTYGGQFLAQALMAARAGMDPERRVHSLHAYFLAAGDVDLPTTYEVEAVRSGRSFAVSQVSARQGEDGRGREVFRLVASFHSPEDGLDYQPDGGYPIGEVPPPASATIDYPGFAAQHPDFEPGTWDGARRPMEVRYLDAPHPDDTEPHTEPQLMWLRITNPAAAGTGGPPAGATPTEGAPPEPALPTDLALHEAGLAYLSDATLVDNTLLPHGFRYQDARLTGASLDHAMWFHRPARADQWLLYHQEVAFTGGGRGLGTGRFYDQRGDLVATCIQEGLIRWRP